jgi:hypothetical protein
VIDRYATELDVHADGGSRATVTLDLKNCQAGRFVLPLGFGGMDRLEVKAAPGGVVLKPVPGKESSTLEIELPPGIAASNEPALCVCRTGCPGSPKDGRRRKGQDLLPIPSCCATRFVNTGALEIGVYELSVQLPGDLRVQKIAEQLPKPKAQRRLAACSSGPHGWPPGRRPSARQHEAGRPDLDGAQCGFSPPLLWVAAGRPCSVTGLSGGLPQPGESRSFPRKPVGPAVLIDPMT